MVTNIVVLGSTGSIGRSALEVVSRHGGRFRVVGLAAGRNIELLEEQIAEFSPEAVAVADAGAARQLRSRTSVPVFDGEEGLCRVASSEADFVLSAIVGAAGLLPTMAAVRAGRRVGLANKEALVVAGGIVMAEAKKNGAAILPVDSEHSAVFQCLCGSEREHLKKIVLTASGGPFAGMTRRQMKDVTPEEALRHPSWVMGRKITIDSATLMNKGLEVIEAHHLFGVPQGDIEVVIHPESIVHSMVAFRDGCCLAQMSVPDMKAAIAYALTYPDRLEDVVPSLDLCALGGLTFRRPDMEEFPCLSIAYGALCEGGSMPAVLNAANEAAVEAFLGGAIGFNDIPDVIENAMRSHVNSRPGSVEEILDVHRRTYHKTLEEIRSFAA